ncbi:MAG: hypothetical protein NZ929_04335 [Aigarchaeota archaeon]|nr:hypothetical protein [Aigarchaeota archaeon]MCX8192714.1 hypothetical protein [Nitrososphaeria archaeon]MDW7985966.1 hypothetical protein [Nitrososphaerota archaeon]
MSGLNTSEKPVAVFVLTIVSGLLMVAISVYSLFMWFFPPFKSWYPPMYGPMWCHMCGWITGTFNWSFFTLFMILTIAFGVIILLSGFMAYMHPENIQIWGVIIVIFSTLSLLSGGVLIIASILGLASGIIALTWKKT